MSYRVNGPTMHGNPRADLPLQATFVLIALVFVATAGYSAPSRLSPQDHPLPASLDGRAYDVVTDTGVPTAVQVSTELPVLRYAGASASGSHIAYTTLEALDETVSSHRRQVTSDEAFGGDVELVPSGDLYVEHLPSHTVRRVDLDDHYVIALAWSPRDPSLLAYTFSSGSEFGLATVNLRTGRVVVHRHEGVLADYLTWSRNGLVFFERDGFLPMADSEGFEVEHFRPIALTPSRPVSKAQAPLSALTAEERLFDHQGLQIRLGDGTTVHGDTLAGVHSLELRSNQGTHLQALDVTAIEAISPAGIVVKTIDEEAGTQALLYVGQQGRVTPLVSAATTVSYYMPFNSGTSVAVTQSGSGYSPSCGITSHKGNLAYAYDLQSAVGAYDGILAAASGTVAYLKTTVTCNSADTVGCSDYRSACSSNSGFGNAVIIQHADGRWTMYAHLKYGSVKPPRTGVSVSRGCHLGNQGHTGASSGNRNGCGDHLHVQRQTGSSVTSASTTLTWTGFTNPLSCKSYTANNGGMSCIFR